MKEVNPIAPTIDSSGNFIKLLKEPSFLSFFLSVVFSQIGFNMMNVLLILLIYKLTTSNFAVSLLVLSFLLPQLFFSFLGGIIGDAKNKRKILMFGNIVRAASLLLLFFFHSNLFVIYFVTIVVAIVTQFYVPAEAPMIPHLIKRDEELLGANALFGVSLFGSVLIGYILAGIALHLLGASGAVLLTAIMFLCASISVIFLPNVSFQTHKLRIPGGILVNMRHLYKLVFNEFVVCLSILREKRNASHALIFLILSQVIILLLATIVPGYAKTTLGILPEDTSVYIFAPAGFGMIIAAFVIGSVLAGKNKQKIMSTGIFLSSIVLFLFASVDYQHTLNILDATIIITFFAGASNSLIFVPSQTIIQSEITEHNRSKIYGLLFAAVGFLALLPIVLAGVFADVLGVRAVLIGISVFLFAIGIGNIFVYRK